MNFAWNLKNPGWCTPTILVGVIGLLGIIALSVQLLMNKDKSKDTGLLISLVSKVLWTVGIGALLYWLCSNGRFKAAWW